MLILVNLSNALSNKTIVEKTIVEQNHVPKKLQLSYGYSTANVTTPDKPYTEFFSQPALTDIFSISPLCMINKWIFYFFLPSSFINQDQIKDKQIAYTDESKPEQLLRHFQSLFTEPNRITNFY